MRLLRAGLCSIALRPERPETIVELAAECGLAGVEWGADVHVQPGDLRQAERVRRWCADAGVSCASYGSYLFAGEAAASDAAEVADTALALGAVHVRVWTPIGVGPGAPPDERRAVVDGVSTIASTMVERGLTVSLEYHTDTLTHTAASANALLESAAVEGLYAYWQPDWTLPVDALLDEYRAIAGRNSHLHVFAWANYHDRYPLAKGEAVWPAVLSEAAAAGQWPHERYAFIEHVVDDTPQQVRDDAAVLLDWIEEAQR